MFSKGIYLQQRKEPALSKDIIQFVCTEYNSFRLEQAPVDNPDKLTPDQIISIAREAAIIDEYDGRPLFRKLIRWKDRAAAIVVDAVDDEPYVSSQIGPLLRPEQQKEVLQGLNICKKVLSVNELYIAVYRQFSDFGIRLPSKLGDAKIMRLQGRYPAQTKRSRQFPIKDKPILYVGTNALIHLYRAIYEGRPQTTAFITVAGNCVANPVNLETSLGMTVTQVLERCGMLARPTRVVCGGSMTGINVIDPDKTLITPITRAVLAFKEDKRDRQYRCIGCGRCIQVCPMGLNPMQISKSYKNHVYSGLEELDAWMCGGCSTCSYVCPSKLDIAADVKKAKEYVKAHGRPAAGEGDEDEA